MSAIRPLPYKMMDFEQLIKQRRSIRDFLDKPVPWSLILQLIQDIGVPDGFKIIAPIIVGYPRQIPPAPPRNDPKILKIIK